MFGHGTAINEEILAETEATVATEQEMAPRSHADMVYQDMASRHPNIVHQEVVSRRTERWQLEADSARGEVVDGGALQQESVEWCE